MRAHVQRGGGCERHEAACSTPAVGRLLLDEDGGLLLSDDDHLDDAGDPQLGLERAHEGAVVQGTAR